MTNSVGGSSKEKQKGQLNGCGVVAVNVTTDAVEGSHGGTESKFCSDEHRRAAQFCMGKNKVPLRANFVVPRVRSWGELRPYSISPILNLTRTLMPRCQNLNDYLSSIKLGTRSWPNSQNSNDDAASSVFVPFDCYVPSLPPPPAKTCDILGQYNHVIFHGDSLTRHMRQAMYMSMRGNFISGGVMTHAPHVLDQCTCDGQFSEAYVCRTFESYFHETIQPREISGEIPKLCPAATFTFGKQAMAPWLTRKGKTDPGRSVDWNNVDCADTTFKGLLLVMQGGLHWLSNASDTFENMVQPVVVHPKYRECACLGKVRLLWVAMNVQSTAYDEQWPHQSREKALIFNEEMRNSFISIGLTPGEDVLILDWWNMTVDAQTSDGLHYLSDVNLAKAAQILYLAEHWPFPKPYSVC
eukprot:CAMPEP_0172304864 /NCGR_PEP_ID=MMETSP1058-20130122/6234_1 /TAXON_ID=83371 /ORGANISM="Detonula confervacea, Strain CCMP 353" /LENGTH=410 /DNA_ID=CAMNT_0013016263 /DNA_START=272 /DNA_END=1504 /DNA_ORIENTATION=+